MKTGVLSGENWQGSGQGREGDINRLQSAENVHQRAIFDRPEMSGFRDRLERIFQSLARQTSARRDRAVCKVCLDEGWIQARFGKRVDCYCARRRRQ